MRLSQTHIIILIGVFFRIIVAIWNGFYGPSPGADLDALGLNGFASSVAVTGDFDEFYIGYTPYTNLLGMVYRYTYNHIFVGSLLSCLIWWLSAYVLHKSFLLFFVEKKQIQNALLIYALLPSSIFMTSVTIREPYQLLFINLALYAVLKIYLHKSIGHWFTLIISIIGAGALHGGLLAFGLLFAAGTLLLIPMREKNGISWPKLGLMGAIAAASLIYAISFFGNISYDVGDSLGGSIELYQQSLLSVDARTSYKTDVVISNLADLSIVVPVGLFQYLFEPFPWHVSAASDIVVLLENILRGWLILRAWNSVRIAPSQHRRVLLFIFISYFAMEAIWSIGTINWGTSIRHHLPALGLLLVAAYATCTSKVYENKRHRIFDPKKSSEMI